MGQHLLLTIRLHGDGQGYARYHGTAQGAPEWPPAPARVFQALLSGSARGNALPEALIPALEWLEALPPPLIAAPRAHPGERVSLFVPNNDADSLDDPRDVSSIRTRKVVHPTLLEEGPPFLYAWPLPRDRSHADIIVDAANNLYQLGRGTDMAWAVGEVIDDDVLHTRLVEHPGTVHRPESGVSGKALACPASGSLASLVHRYRARRLRLEGVGRSARLLLANSPKPRFSSVTYERAHNPVVYDLLDRESDTKRWPWPLHRVVKLVETLRDGAAARLRDGLPNEQAAIERTLIGRKADGSDPSPVEQRARIIPLPSIGHEHADRAVRRIVLDVPSGMPLRAADIEWAFSTLETAEPDTGGVGPFVLARTDTDDMLRHYAGPARRWRSVTAVVLPESARRRRIEPKLRPVQTKNARERIGEEDRAVAAVHVALRHAGVRGTAIEVRVQREPFEAKGARAEAFADGTRFSKERLWHVDLSLDEPVAGPLVIGDGRFLGLGVMAPVTEPWSKPAPKSEHRVACEDPVVGTPKNRSGLFCLEVLGNARNDSVALARALRRAVMARAQTKLDSVPLGRFFSGHEESGEVARTDHTSHLTFQWDPQGRRLLVIAPHWLDRREPTKEERGLIELLDGALDELLDLRAGAAGRFAVRRQSLGDGDPLLAPSRSWISATPYTATRHKKRATVAEVLIEDLLLECHRRRLPRPTVTVFNARGVQGRGLEASVRLEFAVAVAGPIVIGRTRYLGGGLFSGREG